MSLEKNQSFPRRLRNALAGLRHAVAHERSARTHLLATVLVGGALAWFQPGAVWVAVVVIAVGLVWVAELINTAIEVLIDHLHPAQHEQVRIIKDCAAAAVLVASLVALGVALALAVHLFF